MELSVRFDPETLAFWGGASPSAEVDEALRRAAEGEPDRAEHAHHGDMAPGEMDHAAMGHGGMQHGEMGHGDMMAIVGEPSHDGLVMEEVELQAGPVGVALPAGLVVRATLDGDVVAHADVRAELRAQQDPLAPIAWALAARGTAELRADSDQPIVSGWDAVAALEVERAASHLCWLARLLRLIGWRSAREEVLGCVGAFSSAHAALRAAILGGAGVYAAGLAAQTAGVLPAAERLTRLVDARRLAARTDGVGALEPHGDARERTAERIRAGVASLQRAAEALDRLSDGAPPSALLVRHDRTVQVDGPRGTLHADIGAHGEIRVAEHGAEATRDAAARAAAGHEWASALVAVASFDPSPWRMGP